MFGDFNTNTISPFQVCGIVQVALAPVIVAFAGIPATVRLELAPTGLLSGTGTLITPEFTVTEPGTGGGVEPTLNWVPKTHATPPHTGPAGVIATTGKGLTVNSAQLEILAPLTGAHAPVNITR